jgi:aspartyl-tRNA(Asn)/glutamyl-tRNA(Gln) amidotransferase subunit C
MKVDEELIRHVARSARLDLSAAEVGEFLPQLKDILTTFSEISKVDTEGIEPSYHPVGIKPHARKDSPKISRISEDALKLGLHKDGYFRGPRVI